jgi:tellurite resistance protein
MMTKDALNDRRQALEDEFFHRVDEKLLANMRAKSAAEANRKQLQAATGISDTRLLDELLATGVPAESVAALTLVPLVLVAWADGKVDPEEREPIMNAAKEQGIESDSPSAKLLDHWLTTKPKRELASIWTSYVAAIMEKMSDEAKAALRNSMITRATAVAKASGGILGIGKLSSDEKQVLGEIEQALAR